MCTSASLKIQFCLNFMMGMPWKGSVVGVSWVPSFPATDVKILLFMFKMLSSEHVLYKVVPGIFYCAGFFYSLIGFLISSVTRAFDGYDFVVHV